MGEDIQLRNFPASRASGGAYCKSLAGTPGAESCPQAGRDQTALWSVLGSHVADFPFFSQIRETSRPRLESTILALARPREALVQSSATRDLVLALGHRPRPLGARLATPSGGTENLFSCLYSIDFAGGYGQGRTS